MSPDLHIPVLHADCFPRVSGDEPPPEIAIVAGSPFSPRERG